MKKLKFILDYALWNPAMSTFPRRARYRAGNNNGEALNATYANVLQLTPINTTLTCSCKHEAHDSTIKSKI